MLDRALQPFLHRALVGPARRLAGLGIAADQLTLAGFTIGLAALPLLAAGRPVAALAAILVNRLLDGLDGAVARLVGPTDRGAFLDIACDFFFYAAVPFGFALADPAANALPAAFLLLAFVGTGSSFLAFAAVAARRGMAEERLAAKGIRYLGGLTEGTETLACFAAMCLWPAGFPLLAWVFGTLCLVTTATRWWTGWRSFGQAPDDRHPQP
ncbi:phosphatidylglycerophosphate synthase [Stella humosa]|uniref:Phosphatidylglycerophosphate synthase n=1 Tax=Stella humosa TaxID=94 RepID=A0A3N1MER9_9PROT|nr:CDP-alcohol phosphatidyltransferase family protein [Stella humosa]ROQ01210.1 phosphatidylglycerophosphate synthase [Stella humosa]BBK31584.1 membrane protein [Stella humosa]